MIKQALIQKKKTKTKKQKNKKTKKQIGLRQFSPVGQSMSAIAFFIKTN